MFQEDESIIILMIMAINKKKLLIDNHNSQRLIWINIYFSIFINQPF